MSDDETPRSKTLPWRTTTVAVFGLLLVLQGFLSFVISPEPYPAIRMPQFARAAAPDGTFQITRVIADVINQDGSVQQISPNELMAGFRDSSAGPSFDYIFTPGRSERITPAVREWLKKRIVEIEQGAVPAELRICFQDVRARVTDSSVVSEKPCDWTVIDL